MDQDRHAEEVLAFLAELLAHSGRKQAGSREHSNQPTPKATRPQFSTRVEVALIQSKMASTSPAKKRSRTSLERHDCGDKSADADDGSTGLALPPEVWARVLECESFFNTVIAPCYSCCGRLFYFILYHIYQSYWID